MGDTVVGLSSGGNGGGGGVIAVVLIVIVFLFIWMWRSGAFQQQPSAPAAPAAAPPPEVGAQNLPPFSSCNCASSSSCNAFCGNTAMFNLCCFGTQTPPATVPPITTPPTEAPTDPNVEENPSICDSTFNGSCNVECGANGDLDTCAECNSTCGSEIMYTGPGSEEEEEDGTAAPAVPTCPAGYTYNVQTNLCVATAAPSYPSTPIPPPLTSQANPTVCSNVYNGSCNSECASGSSLECNNCMIACGQATGGTAGGGGTSGGRTAECSSRYNGSCNTECSSGNNSTCNACRAACGLAANIASVVYASSAKKLLKNRLYNSVMAQAYSSRRRKVGYERQSRAVGNIYRIAGLR